MQGRNGWKTPSMDWFLPRAKGPAVYLAQPEGLGYRPQHNKRANGPAVRICTQNYYPFNPWPTGQAVTTTDHLVCRDRSLISNRNEIDGSIIVNGRAFGPTTFS